MLSLSRRPGESIWVGDEIEVKVVSVRGCKVRLAIVAPEEFEVDRDEVRRKKLSQAQDLCLASRVGAA